LKNRHIQATCRSGKHAGLAKRQTASTYLKELAAIGVLQEHKIGREKLFLNPGFIDLLKRD
jgi:Fic family protein